MGFSNQERLNLLTKALAAGVLDANSVSVWYETWFPFRFINESTTVWLELATLRLYPAPNQTVARENAALPALATIVSDLSQPVDAVRLTEVPGTNGSTYAAYSTYGDASSEVLKNWLLPALVPQVSGMPSNGYSIRLYEGDPAAGGVEISTTAGTTGVGDEKTVGWIWNYANGMLLLSVDFRDIVVDPYVAGFRYVGRTAADTETDLHTLESSVGTLSGDVTTLEGDVTTLGGEVTALDVRVGEAEVEIDVLQVEVEDLQHSIVGMGSRFVKGG